MNCKICQRKLVNEGFCTFHMKAYENIVDKYDIWKKSLQISWKEYLSEIEQNPLTGEWAKEVANYLIKSEETKSVKES